MLALYDYETGNKLRDASKAEIEAFEGAGGPVRILDVDGCSILVVVAEPVGAEVEQ